MYISQIGCENMNCLDPNRGIQWQALVVDGELPDSIKVKVKLSLCLLN
jgi:hypothetical protein